MIHPARHKQLFLDDGCIESKANVTRRLHQPAKRGPVLRPDSSRGQFFIESRNTPQWHPEKRLWEWLYFAAYRVPPYGERGSTTWYQFHYATSRDGEHWDKPTLGLYEWQGRSDNNIFYDPYDRRRRIYHLIRDEADPDPARRYKGIFRPMRDVDREPEEKTFFRFPGHSADGLNWTTFDDKAVPSGDESHFVFDDISGRYVMMLKSRLSRPLKWGRSVSLSTSADFLNWTDPKLVFHTDEIDVANRFERARAICEDLAYVNPGVVDDKQRAPQAYNMAIMPYEGLYVGMPAIFTPTGAFPAGETGFTQVELTVSRDLEHWTRVADRDIFIPLSPWDGESYDTAQVLSCGRPVVRDDEIWVYYNALMFRTPPEFYGEEYQDRVNDWGALSLAKLRLDGFVSLDAEGPGEIITRPFVWTGQELRVNANAARGELRAEILDAETMAPLPGLSADACAPLKEDCLRGRLLWPGEEAGAARPVRIRFLIQRAQLYAFWLAPRRAADEPAGA